MKRYIEGWQPYYTEFSEILKDGDTDRYLTFRENLRQNVVEPRRLVFNTFWSEHEATCNNKIEHYAKKEAELREIESFDKELDGFDRIFLAHKDILNILYKKERE